MTMRMKAISEAVVRSAPNPDRPRLSEEHEKRLYESDRQRAACYAEIEDITEQLKEVADDLTAIDTTPAEQPIRIEFEDDSFGEEESSLVIAIESVKQATQT